MLNMGRTISRTIGQLFGQLEDNYRTISRTTKSHMLNMGRTISKTTVLLVIYDYGLLLISAPKPAPPAPMTTSIAMTVAHVETLDDITTGGN